MTNEIVTGGCLCGAVRYRVENRMTGGLVCHCRMCQQASGTAFTYNAVYARESLQLTHGEPLWFASSEIADRGFCRACGSPLFVRYSVAQWSGWIAVAIASHDRPDDIPAERHFGVESQMAWLHIDDDLPRVSYPDGFLQDVATQENKAYAALPQRGSPESRGSD